MGACRRKIKLTLPININMKFKEYYEKYWNKRIEEETNSIPAIRSSIPNFLVKYSQYGTILNQVPENSSLLDIGCGQGKVASLFLKKNCKVTGIDVSVKALAIAVKTGINTKSWDLNDLPLPFDDESFEVITISDVLEHVIDPVALLKDARRLLTSGGKLIISVPNFARWDNRFRMLAGCPKDILHWKDYGDGLEHLHWFTKPKLTSYLQLSGFGSREFIPTGLPFGFIFGKAKMHGLARILTIVSYKEKINPVIRKTAQRVKEHFYPNCYSRRYQISLEQILKHLKGPRVLELGIGSGWLMREMHSRGFEVIGLDYSEKSLSESQFIFNADNLSIPLVSGTGEKLPFKDSSFDSVTMLGVLEHIPDPSVALREVRRILRPDGLFFVSVPNTYTYGCIYDRFISPFFNDTSLGYDRVMDKHFSKIGLRRIHESSDDHIIQFTAKVFKEMLLEEKFKVLEFFNMEFLTSYLASFWCGLLKQNRKHIRFLEEIDVKIAKKIPLNIGSGWLAICKKQ